ncbi:putative short-chain dehydrogenase [Talaromyces proteolyticus]|uniref:Short-chain dehydrogenase n=1 Tax=Talaromyces proteolyticus TaxID=1131652 RepID=A0AAD4L1C6_9EURO|nr:putative short-chain dehydrogenase [Talaromyces proteolyticus]KAH8701099.1 putative short-chain dehydrogenase [Talaromyces proteolyticus]
MGGFLSSMAPPLTEANLPDQTGKVFIVTGATSGYGLLLATILYQRNGTVYLAARDTTKLQQVADGLRTRFPNSTGSVHSLALDLSDLSTIKRSADEFLSRESKLHVLWHNAGVMIPRQGSTTKQGYELQLGTNNVGPTLLTKLLYPALKNAAADPQTPKDSVRVVWVSSVVATRAPTPAIDFDNMDYHTDEGAWSKYGRSKAGNVLQAAALARRGKDDGITLDPGVAMTGLQRTMPGWLQIIVRLIAQKPEIGAYTQLYAGLQPDLDVHKPETWVVPPGKLVSGRADFFDRELSERFWDWNEEQVKAYL